MESTLNENVKSASQLLEFLNQLSQQTPFVFSLCLNVVLGFAVYKIAKLYFNAQKTNGSLKLSMMNILSAEMNMSFDEAKARIKAMSNYD